MRSAPGDEDVLAAVVVEQLACEPAVESLEAKPRDVDQAQPFVLGRPPQRTGSTVVQRDVDAVVADAVADRVRDRHARRRVGVLPFDGGCDPMVEGESVPRKATTGAQRRGYPLEAPAAIGPRGEMQQRPAG